MKATFENSLNKLITAYLNNTLEHGVCTKCAVGNLLGTGIWSSLFLTVTEPNLLVKKQIRYKPGHIIGIIWNDFVSIPIKNLMKIGAFNRIVKAKIAVKKSGYTIDELQRIEFGFETANKGANEDDYMFNGLMAVVDVLADIHQVDLKVKEEAKLMFVK